MLSDRNLMAGEARPPGRGGIAVHGFKHFRTENGLSNGQNMAWDPRLALTVFHLVVTVLHLILTVLYSY